LALISLAETQPDTPCRDAVAITARTSGVSHSWYGLILSAGGLSITPMIMSGTLIGYGRCSTDAQDLMAWPTMYRTLQHSQASQAR